MSTDGSQFPFIDHRCPVSIPVEACAFDETTYSNPDPRLQALVRELLHDFGMVVVIPRRPLEEAASYHVTITVNGAQYDWSFSTPKTTGPRAQLTEETVQ